MQSIVALLKDIDRFHEKCDDLAAASVSGMYPKRPTLEIARLKAMKKIAVMGLGMVA